MKDFVLTGEKLALEREKEIEKREKKVRKLQDEQILLAQKSKQARAELNALVLEKQVAEPLDEVFETIDDMVSVDVVSNVTTKERKKSWNKRPDCWMDIAKHYQDYGLKNTLDAFKEEMTLIPKALQERNIVIWNKNLKSGTTPKYSHRMPEYGGKIDLELYAEVMQRVLLGLTVDPTTLREMLLVLLLRHSKMVLVQNNGSFGYSWAQRFFKRHGLRSRAVSTKMREEIPADFDLKEQTYIEVGAKYIAAYDIPPEPVYGIDETNALFVSRSTRQRVLKGTRRVRAIGVGKEKAQITVTLGACEGTGKMLPTQYIFEGKYYSDENKILILLCKYISYDIEIIIVYSLYYYYII